MSKNKSILNSIVILLFIAVSVHFNSKQLKENSRKEYTIWVNNYLNETSSSDEESLKKGFKNKRHEDLNRQWQVMFQDPVTKELPSGKKILDIMNQIEQGKFSNRSSTDLEWEELGPNTIGGRTRAIMVDPNDNTNKTVFAAGVSGGLWKTDDITATTPTWEKVDHTWDNIKIVSLTYDPLDTQIFYASTGEFAGTSGWGNGVYKSTDGGTSWSHLSSTSTWDVTPKVIVRNEGGTSVVYAGQSVTSTKFHNWDSSTSGLGNESPIYGGIHKSTDGGASWTQVGPYTGYQYTASSTPIHYNVSQLVLGASDRIWMGTDILKSGFNNTQPMGGLYYSDDGDNWTEVDFRSGSANSTRGIGRVEVAVAPSDKNTIYIAASGGNEDDSSKIYWVMKSTDNGTSWTDLPIPSDVIDNGWYAGENRQAYYDLTIAVDPNDANTLILGQVTQYKSTDGGQNWEEISYWVSGAGKPYVHADQHNSLYIDSNQIIASNDGGVFYSSNGGTSWSSKIEGYNVGQFWHADIHPSEDKYVLGGTQDNGSWRIKNSASYEGQESGGDGAFSHFDNDDPNYQFTQVYYNYVYRTSNEWASSSIFISDQTNGYFVCPSDYDSVNQIYYMSSNTNGDLRALANARTASHSSSATAGEFLQSSVLSSRVSSIEVSPHDPSIVFVGDSSGNLTKITNANTATSTTVNEIDLDPSNTLPAGYIHSIDIGADDNHILITFSNYNTDNIWVTTDNGTTWTNLDGNLPNMNIGAAVFNPNNRSEVIVGTELGVWSSDNINAGSVQWSANNGTNAIPNVPVHWVEIRNSDSHLVAATHGRGIWYSESLAAPTTFPAATFTINNIDNSYIRSVADVIITPDFSSVTDFTPATYWMAIGSSSSVMNDVEDWTEVTLSNGELDFAGLALDDYTSYTVSLRGQNANGDYNAEATQPFNTYSALLGDSDADWDVDLTDLNALVAAWPGIDIGPATGAAPYMAPSFDQQSDIHDISVFARNWAWTAGSRGIEQIQPTGVTPLIDDLNIIKFGNTITIEIPEGITSGRIQIDKPTDGTSFRMVNNLSDMLVLEDDGDFYQLAFGNLSKTTGMITLEVNNGADKMNLAYEMFTSQGSVESSSVVISDPTENKLYQNYPNPFNAETTIKYDLAESTSVTIHIYNMLGDLVKVIDQGDQTPGQYTVIWDATNDNNEMVSSGVYLYQLRTKNYNKAEKMTLVK